MNFVKMQGLGNDFIVTEKPGWDEALRLKPCVSALCNRNYGIGADGLVITGPGTDTDLFMRVFNPDGSEAEMCGNAIRCIVYYAEKRNMIKNTPVKIKTRSGIKYAELTTAEDGTSSVRVDMGEPILDKAHIPMRGKGGIITSLEVPGQRFDITAVSVGNPHCVIFVEDIGRIDVAHWGRLIEAHELFPNRTNVEFVQINGPWEMTMRVWERGTGITMACGTGACAGLTAAVLNNLTSRKALIHLDGGVLFVEWNADDNHLYMKGSAREVFQGNIDLDTVYKYQP